MRDRIELSTDLIKFILIYLKGTGWWKYDFCYGKYVKQVHVDEKAGFQTTVLLGEFYEDDHLEWIAQNPQKRPKPKGINNSFF